jgi:hypothetical protein
MSTRTRLKRWVGLATLVLTLPAGSARIAGAFQQNDRLEINPQDAARGPDLVQVQIVGRVANVSRDGRGFRVEAGEVRFDVEPGFATRFPTLKEGDRVLVSGTLRNQTRLSAQDVRVLGARNPRTLTGIIRDVDRRRSRILVRADDGTVVEAEYTTDTLFARLGRKATVEQLRIGDEVWVDGSVINPRLVRAKRVEVTALRSRWQSGQSGEIVSVSRRDRTLRVDFGEETRTVTVIRDANISRGTRMLGFDELHEGDRIRISGELRGDAVDARGIEVVERPLSDRIVEGRVRAIDLNERALRVAVNSLIPITVRVYVPPGTQISRGTHRLTLEEIREGDRIRARGPSRDSGVEAATLEILP